MIRLILIFTFLIVNLSQLSLAKIASVIGNPNTEEIYFEVNKDTRNYPASLTKIMTLYIIFDEINLGKLDLNDNIIDTNSSENDLIDNIKRRTKKHIPTHKDKTNKGYNSWQPK